MTVCVPHMSLVICTLYYKYDNELSLIERGLPFVHLLVAKISGDWEQNRCEEEVGTILVGVDKADIGQEKNMETQLEEEEAEVERIVVVQ